MTLDARDGLSGSPRIGAEEWMGEPGSTATVARELACSEGEL